MIEREICMVAPAARGNNDAHVARTRGEPQVIGQEGNLLGTRHGDGPLLPQQQQHHLEEHPHEVKTLVATSSRSLCCTRNTSARGSPLTMSHHSAVGDLTTRP